jgi:hypothetical protein
MPEKTQAKEKKATTTKPVAAAKKNPVSKATARKPASGTASARKINKGDSLTCEVCGFSVTVDECGDVIEAEEIICCDKPMKPKARKVKAAAK